MKRIKSPLILSILLAIGTLSEGDSQDIKNEFPLPIEALKSRSQFYGYLPGHTSLEESGWFAHTSSKVNQYGLAHATFFEELPDYFSIRMSYPTNFQRSYLSFDRSVELPGINKPGRVIARIRRDALVFGEAKMMASGHVSHGVRIISKEISDLNDAQNKIPWDYTQDTDWHDWILTLDGENNATFSIDGKPELTLKLVNSDSESGEKNGTGYTSHYLTFGNQRVGVQRTLDIAALHFLLPNEEPPAPPTNVMADGPYKQSFPNGSPRITANFSGGQVDGTVTRYHSNGAPWSSGEYSGGKKQGEWKYTNPAGVLLGRETFIDGEWNGLVEVNSMVDDTVLFGEYQKGISSSPAQIGTRP